MKIQVVDSIEIVVPKIQVMANGVAVSFNSDCQWAEMDNGSLIITRGCPPYERKEDERGIFQEEEEYKIIATFASGEWQYVRQISDEI